MFCLATERETPLKQSRKTRPPWTPCYPLKTEKSSPAPPNSTTVLLQWGILGDNNLPPTGQPSSGVFLTLLDEKPNEKKQPSLQITLLNVSVCVAFLYICLFFFFFFLLLLPFIFLLPLQRNCELLFLVGCFAQRCLLFLTLLVYAIYHKPCVRVPKSRCYETEMMLPAGRKTSPTNPESYQQKCTPV